MTIPFLTEGFRDGQSAALHSLWIEETGFWSLRDKDHLTLYKKLLSPPLRFLLSLKTAACARNEIHLAVANDHALLRADTKLFFTVDNVVHHFTTYELDQAIKQGGTGKEPGVQLLIRFLGKPPVSQAVIPLKGRPPAEQGQAVRKIVAASGMPLKAS